jgi:DNA-binding transcriptional MerR regulator
VNGNGEDKVETSVQEPMPQVQQRPNKIEEKRAKIYADRRARALGRGIPEAQVDEMLAKEDFDRLPVDEKLRRTTGAIVSDLQRLQAGINNLRQNDGVLAESMDVNFRALSKILVKLGITVEEQREIMNLSVAEIQAENQARIEMQVAAQKARAPVEQQIEQAGTPSDPPPEATVFS